MFSLPKKPLRRRRRAVATLVACAVVVGAVAVSPQVAAADSSTTTISTPIQFFDTFDNGHLDGWSSADEPNAAPASSWSAKSNAVVQTQATGQTKTGTDDTSGIPGEYSARLGTDLIAGNTSWANYDFSATAVVPGADTRRTPPTGGSRPTPNTPSADVGIVFRYVDSNDFYRFSIGDGYERLEKKVAGAFTLLATNTVSSSPGVKYTLKVIVNGTEITTFVNGTQTFDLSDSTFNQGRFGFYASDAAGAVFDNAVANVDITGTTVDSNIATVPGSFSIVALPDTQFYSAKYPSILVDQMRWIAQNRAKDNIAMVLGEGDIVDDTSIGSQWTNAYNGYEYIDGKIPFVANAGNKDVVNYLHAKKPYSDVTGSYNAMMRKFSDYPVDASSGGYNNVLRLFSAGGVQWAILDLMYGPTDSALAWARKMANMYSGRHIILLTHAYLGADGSPISVGITPETENPTWNDGAEIYSKLIKQTSNIQFVFSGHVATGPEVSNYATPKNGGGRMTYEVVTNFESDAKGGGGYLRIFSFNPSNGTFAFRTYSPYTKKWLITSTKSHPRNTKTFRSVNFAAF